MLKRACQIWNIFGLIFRLFLPSIIKNLWKENYHNKEFTYGQPLIDLQTTLFINYESIGFKQFGAFLEEFDLHVY